VLLAAVLAFKRFGNTRNISLISYVWNRRGFGPPLVDVFRNILPDDGSTEQIISEIDEAEIATEISARKCAVEQLVVNFSETQDALLTAYDVRAFARLLVFTGSVSEAAALLSQLSDKLTGQFTNNPEAWHAKVEVDFDLFDVLIKQGQFSTAYKVAADLQHEFSQWFTQSILEMSRQKTRGIPVGWSCIETVFKGATYRKLMFKSKEIEGKVDLDARASADSENMLAAHPALLQLKQQGQITDITGEDQLFRESLTGRVLLRQADLLRKNGDNEEAKKLISAIPENASLLSARPNIGFEPKLLTEN